MLSLPLCCEKFKVNQMRCLIKTFNDGAIINGIMYATKTKEEIELLFTSHKTLPLTKPDSSRTNISPLDKSAIDPLDIIGTIVDFEIVETDEIGIDGNKVIHVYGNLKITEPFKEGDFLDQGLGFKMKSIGKRTEAKEIDLQKIISFDLS